MTDTTSKCFKVWPREGDCYVGYIFAETRGKARALARDTDPGGEPPSWMPEAFTMWNLARFPMHDGKAPCGTAWWGPNDIAPGCKVIPSDLWHEID